jgi:hypothetical protein
MSRQVYRQETSTRSGPRYVLLRMTLLLVFAAILFAAAGTLNWQQGWSYLICTLLTEVATLIILARQAPETLAQRGAQHAGVKGFDRVFAVSWLALALITPLVAGLDKRLGWSSMPSVALYGGAALLAAGSV